MLNAQRTIALALALSCVYVHAQPVTSAPKPASWYITHAPFAMPPVTQPQFPQRDFRITDYGANGNGQVLNTDAFAKAMKACSDVGGGRVIVPAGQWLTGPIELLAHVDLHLEADALIQFTKDHSQYLDGGKVLSPIYSRNQDDIAITGEGTIDGAGETWRPVKREKMTDAQWQALLASGGVLSSDGKIWWPSDETMKNDRVRPYMVSLSNCHRILIQGVLLRNSPKFVFCPQHCTDLTVDHARIYNEWWAQNGDGMDISACKRVLIYGCTVNAGDDGICMKSSGGNSLADGPALEDIVIAGCTVLRAHGGFVIGSNTDGGMHNIFVSDCTFMGTDVGLRFKSNMGRGGLVNDIFVTGITMKNIVREAVLFDTYYEDQPAGSSRRTDRPTDKTPEFRDFHLSHIDCQGAAAAIAITGLPQMPVSNIAFDTVTIKATKGLTATQCRNITLHDVRLDVGEGPAIRTDRTAEVKVE